ncbi:MAG: hypothetical protein MK193_01650 [Lentisphaeria bacterium]|nr:hypothetical protein [Lentisphaeria bacterium]
MFLILSILFFVTSFYCLRKKKTIPLLDRDELTPVSHFLGTTFAVILFATFSLVFTFLAIKGNERVEHQKQTAVVAQNVKAWKILGENLAGQLKENGRSLPGNSVYVLLNGAPENQSLFQRTVIGSLTSNLGNFVVETVFVEDDNREDKVGGRMFSGYWLEEYFSENDEANRVVILGDVDIYYGQTVIAQKVANNEAVVVMYTDNIYRLGMFIHKDVRGNQVVRPNFINYIVTDNPTYPETGDKVLLESLDGEPLFSSYFVALTPENWKDFYRKNRAFMYTTKDLR